MPPVVAFLTTVGTFVTAGVAVGSAAAVIGTLVVASAVMTAAMLMGKVDMGVADTDRVRQTTVRGTIEPRKLVYGETMISGVVSFAQVNGANNKNLHQVIAIAGHKLTSIDEIFFDDYSINLSTQVDASGDVTSGKFAKKTNEDGVLETMVHIETRDGSSTQTAYSDLVTAFAGTGVNAGKGYESTHRGDNVASIYTRWTLHEGSVETWDEVGGIQNIKAVVKGKAIYDPRLDVAAGNVAGANPTTAAYITYSNGSTTATHQRDLQGQNPALILADYLMDSTFGLGIPSTKIDWPAVITAADACDFLVPIPTSQTQKRFFGSGVIFGSDNHRKSISKILSGMNGDLIYSQGKYIIKAGVHETASLAFTEDDLAGDFTVKTSIPRADRFNTIKGMFIDPDSNYKMTEFAPRTVSGAVARDNGEVLEEEIKLTFTSNRYVAQRIAIKQVHQSFLQTTLMLPVNLKGMKVAVGDRITLALNDFATISSDWNPNKEFKVIGWAFSESGSGAIELSLIEDDSSRYADPAEGDYNQISNTGVITSSLADVPLPTSFTATAGYNSVNLAWTNPTDIGAWEQIWIYASDTTTPPTTPIEKFRGTAFTHQIAGGTAKYYWIQAVKYPLGATPASGSTNTAKSALVPFGSPTAVTALKIANAVMADDSIDTAQIIDDAVGSDQIATALQSSNWSVANQTGWRIEKSGDTTFNNAVIRGNITASTGSIGGITVDADSIHVGTGTFNNANTAFYADDQGQFSLKDKLSWNGTALTIDGGGTFSGALSAATGTFSGALSGGTISIGSGNNIFKADTNGIYLGNATFASAPFRVTPAGALTSTTATLTGALTATSLNIQNTATVTDPANLINNVAIREEVLRVEVTTGDVLDLETGGEVEIQNLGDVAIYVSDQDAILQGNINTVSNALSNLENTVVDLTSGVSDIFIQTTAPVAGVGGIPDPIPDFSRWYDSDDDNHPYYWTGSAWVSLEDPRIGANANAITNLTANLSTTNTNVAANTTLAQGKITTFFQDDTPTAVATGDLWVDTNDKNKLYRWSGSAWVAARDTDISQAITNAATAQSTADSKILTFIQDDMPSGSVGDLWIDSNDSNKLYRHNGTTFVAVRDAGIDANANAITALDSTVVAQGNTVTALSASNTTLTADLTFRTIASAEDGTAIEGETSTPGDINHEELTDVAAAAGLAQADLQTRTTLTEDSITVQSTEITLLNSILEKDGVLTGSANAVTALQTDVTQINTLDGTSTSANASALTALKATVEDPTTGLSAVGGVVSALTANVGDGAVLVSDAQTLYAVTGLATTNNWDVTETYAAGSGVVYLGVPYVAAVANTGETPLNNLSNWTPASTTASLITDNNVSRIGYCVDANGDLTDHKNATLCVAAGNTWNGDAAIAEAVKALRVIKPDGTYATIENATSVISDDVGDVIAQKYVKIDANGAIAGYGLYSTTSSGATESEFVVTADKFKVVDPADTSLTALAPFTVTSQKIVMGTDVEIDGGLVVSGEIKADRLSLNGTMFTTETVGSDVNLVIADGGVNTTQVADNAVNIDKIADTLQSTNYAAGSAGWKLTTDGTFEAGNGTFRGAITATSGSIANSVTVGGTAASTVATGAQVGSTGGFVSVVKPSFGHFDGLTTTDIFTQSLQGTTATRSFDTTIFRVGTQAIKQNGATGGVGFYSPVGSLDLIPSRKYMMTFWVRATTTDGVWSVGIHDGSDLYSATGTALTAANTWEFKAAIVDLSASTSSTGYYRIFNNNFTSGSAYFDAISIFDITDATSVTTTNVSQTYFSPLAQAVAVDTDKVNGTAASTISAGAIAGASAIQDNDTGLTLGLQAGSAGPITISYTAASGSDPEVAKLYQGTGTFNNSNTGFYLDNSGNFSLQDKLAFNGSTLAVSGAITATSGSFTGAVSVGTTGNLYGGTSTAFNTGKGFFLGYSTDDYKLSIGDASTGKSLTWDGDKLNVAANAVSFTTGGEPSYDSTSRVPVSVRSSVLNLTSNTDYVFFANDFDQDLTLYASFYAGPLTSGIISGETNAQNAIMSQLSLQIQYAENVGGSPGTWQNFGSAALSGKKFISDGANSLNSNYYVKVTDLGSGNYRADLATAAQAAADFTGLGYSDFAYGITDEDYYMTEQVTVYGFPKGEYFIRIVASVTDGTYSPYPATGSPALTNLRRLSINNALTYTDSDHGLAAVAKGNPRTYFTRNNNSTLIDGGNVTISVPEQDATSNKYGGIFIAGRGETTNPNSIQPLGGIFFYNSVDDLGQGAGSLGDPDFTIAIPKTGDSLDIDTIGNGININGGYGVLTNGMTIDTNGNTSTDGKVTAANLDLTATSGDCYIRWVDRTNNEKTWEIEADVADDSTLYFRHFQNGTTNSGLVAFTSSGGIVAGGILSVAGGYSNNGVSIDASGNYQGKGNISIDGTLSQGSDIRLKSNVETIDGSKVFDMRGVSFVKNGEQGAGVIAQELQEIAPELVKEGSDGMLSVAYGDLIGYLIESVKTLKDEIDQIKADQS